MLGIFDVAVAGMTVGIHMLAMKIVKEVKNFFGFWENEQICSIGRWYLKSLVPIKINMGPFFYMQPSTLLNTFMQIVGMIVTMLLA